MIVRTQQDDVIDALCWRHYGHTNGVVEAVMAANPSLSTYGPVLPMGIDVEMPDVTPAPSNARLINLFD